MISFEVTDLDMKRLKEDRDYAKDVADCMMGFAIRMGQQRNREQWEKVKRIYEEYPNLFPNDKLRVKWNGHGYTSKVDNNGMKGCD